MQESEDMAGYRRFIAYVYEYPQGKKGNGKGFIRVEARDGVCRIQYKLAGLYGKESAPGKVYGYIRQNGQCRGILLGDCDMAGTSVQFEHETEEENMGNSGYALNELGGLVLRTDSGETYGSGWDEQPIHIDEITFPEESESVETEEVKAGTEEQQPEEQPQEQQIKQEALPLEAVQDEEIHPAVESEMEEIIKKDMKETEVKKEDAKEEGSNIFSDNSIYECMRITPFDCRRLGRRDRGLMNNNFLRHGYKNYGHLILGRREEDDRYILGIPGIYECQESLMAGMFGFPYFKETGGRQSGGRFGYWYRLIDTPDWDDRKRD